MFLQAQMALHFGFRQGVHERFIHAFRRHCRKSQTHCQLIGSLECNAGQLYQAVGMLADNIQRLVPILTVDLNGSAGSDAMRSQKCDHIPGTSGGQVGIPDLLQLLGADPPDGHQLLRLVVKDLQSVLPEGIVDLLCDPWANTLDLTGCQVADNALLGMGDHFLVAFHLELQAVSRMLVPVTAEAIAELLGCRKTISNRFDLADHFAVCVFHNAAGTVYRDHIVDG